MSSKTPLLSTNPSQRLAFISGASAGIGKSTAMALAQAQYDLFILARRNERLQDLKKSILDRHPQCRIITATGDVRSPQHLETLFKDHEKDLQNLEVIINNAGLAKGTKAFQAGSLDDFDLMIDTNIKGLLYTTKLLLPHLLQSQRGHIINLGSVAGRWVYPGGAVYCASKFAVRAITEGLRQDLIGTGLKVTNIEPGMVETEFSVVRLGDQKKADAVYQGMTPLTPEDIAETIVWCLSRPAHVNIQEIVIFPTDQASVSHVYRK